MAGGRPCVARGKTALQNSAKSSSTSFSGAEISLRLRKPCGCRAAQAAEGPRALAQAAGVCASAGSALGAGLDLAQLSGEAECAKKRQEIFGQNHVSSPAVQEIEGKSQLLHCHLVERRLQSSDMSRML